ncbi:MAG: hypothetical protein AB1634_06740 [Thermodesulfobacteriota bacterium]
MKGLSRLGASSPLAAAPVLFDAAGEAAGAGCSRLAILAQEKLGDVRLLLDQRLTASALELLLSALLAAAADRAGLDHPVSPQEAGVWICGEAATSGIFDAQEVGLLLRGVSLAQAAAVPEPLVTALVDEVARFVAA